MYGAVVVREKTTVVRVQNLTIDLQRRRVSIGERVVRLQSQEYQFLALLAEHQGSCVTWVMFSAWMHRGKPRTRKLLHVYAHKIREKFIEIPGAEIYIDSIWNKGYKLRPPVAQPIAQDY